MPCSVSLKKYLKASSDLVEPSHTNLFGRRSTEGLKCSRYVSRVGELMPSAATTRSLSGKSSTPVSVWKRICTPSSRQRSCRSLSSVMREGLHETAHLDDRHRRVMLSHQLAVRGPDRVQRSEILVAVRHVPGQTHDMLGPAARLREHFEYVVHRLTELSGEVFCLPHPCAGPAHLTRNIYSGAAFHRDTVGEAARLGP